MNDIYKYTFNLSLLLNKINFKLSYNFKINHFCLF